jgi:hypothetical protein
MVTEGPEPTPQHSVHQQVTQDTGELEQDRIVSLPFCRPVKMPNLSYLHLKGSSGCVTTPSIVTFSITIRKCGTQHNDIQCLCRVAQNLSVMLGLLLNFFRAVVVFAL